MPHMVEPRSPRSIVQSGHGTAMTTAWHDFNIGCAAARALPALCVFNAIKTTVLVQA